MSGPMLSATICRTASGEHEPLAKYVTRDASGGYAVRGFGNATLFTFQPFDCPDIVTFGRKLYMLSKDPAVALLRGEPLPHVKPGRFYHRRFKHAESGTNSIEDRPRAWIAIDCDDIPAPKNLTNWLDDVPAAVAHLTTLLPPELHGVTCIGQVTGSGGFSGDDLLRLRLWYALNRAFSSLAVRTWAQSWNRIQGTKLIDWSVFMPVALNYTADPILGPGVCSPIAKRWFLLPGQHDRASLVLRAEPDAPVRDASSVKTVVTLNRDGSVLSRRQRDFTELCGLIGSPEHGFHGPILAALGRGASDGQDMNLTVEAVAAAVLAADPGHRDKATIQRYASRSFLSQAFRSFSHLDDATRRRNEAAAEHWFRRGSSAIQVGAQGEAKQ